MALKKVNRKDYQTVNVYRESISRDDLKQIRRTLAKRANQRMVRLENTYSNITGESYSSYGAYDFAQEYLKDRKRFSESANFTNNINDLEREITVLQGFLNRETSTISGQRKIENKRIKQFESGNWGINDGESTNRKLKFADTKEFYDFLNSSEFADLISQSFSSETLIEMYDEAREKLDNDTLINNLQDTLETFRKKENKLSIKDLRKALIIL